MLDRLGARFALACPAFGERADGLPGAPVRRQRAAERERDAASPADPDARREPGARPFGADDGKGGLVPFPALEGGAGAIRAAMAALADGGHRFAILDALTERHLMDIGAAAAEHRLVTDGSGVALGLHANFRGAGLLAERADAAALPPGRGKAAVVARSCSRATLGQIARARSDGLEVLELDAFDTPDAAVLAEHVLDWSQSRLGDAPVVIAASAPPDRVAALQRRLGTAAAGALVEDAMPKIASGLVASGVGRLVVAGGETSGAVVSRLGVRMLRIGGEIDPGVPWTHADLPGESLHLALKSGNFGAEDFFRKVFRCLP